MKHCFCLSKLLYRDHIFSTLYNIPGLRGHSTKFYTGKLRSEVQRLAPLHTIFWPKRYPFCIASIDKWFLFHIHTIQHCIHLTVWLAYLFYKHRTKSQNRKFLCHFHDVKLRIFKNVWNRSLLRILKWHWVLFSFSHQVVKFLSYTCSLKNYAFRRGASP